VGWLQDKVIRDLCNAADKILRGGRK